MMVETRLLVHFNLYGVSMCLQIVWDVASDHGTVHSAELGYTPWFTHWKIESYLT